jgi:hypothetical protein
MTLCEIEKAAILETLKQCRWHRDSAAYQLGITSRTLARKIARYRDEGTPIPSWRDTREQQAPVKSPDRVLARSIAGVYKRRGKIRQQPCKACGSPDSQMHHHDYTKPLDVEWLCFKCHRERHAAETAE